MRRMKNGYVIIAAVLAVAAMVRYAESAIDFVEGQKIPSTLKGDYTFSGTNTFTGTTTISGATACTDIQTFAGAVHFNGSVTELGNAAGDAITVTGTATFAEDTGFTKDITVTGNDINLGSATTGVKISSDGDGAITFKGQSSGNDEDLTFNFDDTANTVVVSTASSVSTVDWSAIGHTTTGTVKAGTILSTPASVQTIAGGDTIAADSCGGLKLVTAGGAVTTSTTNTFTAPAAANAGCCMDVVNTGATNTITLDNNTNFISAGGADVSLTAKDIVRVCSDGTNWYQVSAVLSLN